MTVKYAQTLDGRIATRAGQSRWISSPASLVLAHQLRAQHDAILVGVGTAIADDPSLTVRLVQGRDPLRVVVDSRLRLPLSASMLSDGKATDTLVATTDLAPPARLRALRATGARVHVGPCDEAAHVDLLNLLSHLRQTGVRTLMVEGGSGIITSLLRLRAVDRLVVCIAPKLLGAGVEAVGDLGINLLAQALSFTSFRFERYGPDMVFDGLLAHDGVPLAETPWDHTSTGVAH